MTVSPQVTRTLQLQWPKVGKQTVLFFFLLSAKKNWPSFTIKVELRYCLA